MSVSFQRDGSRAFLVLVLSGLLAGCGTGDSKKSPAEPNPSQAKKTADPAPANPETEPGKSKEKSPAGKGGSSSENRPGNEAPQAQLQADLDDAISLLENGELAQFLERYMPLKYLEDIREFSTVEQAAKNMKVGGAFEKQWLEKLRAMKKAEIDFLDEEQSKARLIADVSPEDTDRPEFSLKNPAEENVPKTEGFSGDLQEAIGKAIAALEAGDHRKFVENMFPESELYLTTSDEAMQAISQRLKEHPKMVEQMVADLKALQKLTPKYDAKQTLATFQLNPDTKQARTIQFEKAGTWRMADSAKKIRAEVYKQSQQPPIGVKSTLETEWVRIRDHWRLSQLP